MFRDDRDHLKKIGVACVAVFLLVRGMLFVIYKINVEKQQTSRSRIQACTLIQDETLLRDCLENDMHEYYTQGHRRWGD